MSDNLLNCGSFTHKYYKHCYTLYKYKYLISNILNIINQEGRGQCAVYYTSPRIFIITFSFSLAQQLWGILLNFDWLVQ